MKIITDFKDYYDCMARYDIDRITTFIRNRDKEPQQIKFDNLYLRDLSRDLSFIVIGVAGVLYPCMVYKPFSSETVYCFDPTVAVKCVEKNYNRETISKFFKQFSQKELSEKLFSENGPVFGIFFDNWNLGMGYPEHKHAWIVKNICLSELSFYKVLPPHIAYNEIYKFLCNQANPGRPIPVPDDLLKIQIAGFDVKTSFRKEKSKK